MRMALASWPSSFRTSPLCQVARQSHSADQSCRWPRSGTARSASELGTLRFGAALGAVYGSRLRPLPVDRVHFPRPGTVRRGARPSCQSATSYTHLRRELMEVLTASPEGARPIAQGVSPGNEHPHLSGAPSGAADSFASAERICRIEFDPVPPRGGSGRSWTHPEELALTEQSRSDSETAGFSRTSRCR
jgi:hypothetical protein